MRQVRNATVRKTCAHAKRGIINRIDDIPIYSCNQCGLVVSEQMFTPFDPADLYDDYYKNELDCGRFQFGIEHVVRMFRFFRAFKLFTIYPAARSILDVGSGRGYMLYFLKKYYGYKRTVGTQIAKPAYRFAKDTLGLEMYDKELTDLRFSDGSFDMVTMWHVLEHVRNPQAYVQTIYRQLKHGGRFIVEVPNYDSWTRALTGQYWLGWDVTYHLTFFSPRTLTRLLYDNGFRIDRVRTFSLEYSAFISAQSFISRLTHTNHLFFSWIQGEQSASAVLVFHIAVFTILFPVCLVINLLLLGTRKGEVLLIIARKP